MMFPIFEMNPKDSLLEKFPKLINNQILSRGETIIDSNLALRFVIFCYDKNSKLQEIQNVTERKIAALSLAGVKNPKDYPDILNNEVRPICLMIVEYLKIHNDRIYQMRQTSAEAFQNYQTVIIEGLDETLDDDKKMRAAILKSTLMEDCDKINKRIEAYDVLLYGSSEEGDDIEDKVKPISPESIGG